MGSIKLEHYRGRLGRVSLLNLEDVGTDQRNRCQAARFSVDDFCNALNRQRASISLIFLQASLNSSIVVADFFVRD